MPTLQPDATATLAYTVTVDDDAFNQTLGNVATPGPGGECVEDDDCNTSHPTPGYTLTKAPDPADGATVQPGDTVTYTLTVTNTSDGVVTGAIVTDNLTDVLDNATLDEAPITPTGQATLDRHHPDLDRADPATGRDRHLGLHRHRQRRRLQRDPRQRRHPRTRRRMRHDDDCTTATRPRATR